MNILINLVSGQLLPNYISTLSLKKSLTSIDLLVLVLGDDQLKDNAALLKDIYESIELPDVKVFKCGTSTDYLTLSDKAETLFNGIRSEHPEAHICLDATGGTKVMSIAFFEAFNKPNDNSFAVYTDTQQKQISLLNKHSDHKFEYHSVLDVKSYLKLNRFNVFSSITPDDCQHGEVVSRQACTTEWADFILQNKKISNVYNGIASSAHEAFRSNGSLQFKLKKRPDKLITRGLKLLQRFGILTSTDDFSSVEFADEDTMRYMAGLWLEEYCYLAAVNAGIEHVAMSVEGEWLKASSTKEGNSFNEIDLILVHNNHILIIEVKSADLAKSKSGQDVVHKLDALHSKLGGLHAQGRLISLRTLDESTQDRLRTIKSLNHISGEKIRDLQEYFVHWREKVE